MHPDYQYMLWTDVSARSFIAEHYPWFLPTYEGYPYNIQRADVIRYFVLHKYGGVYLDLDIGCRKPVDPLLNFPALLPVTKPVGVSNDLMFSEPASPFMDAVIHNLMAFDHQYLSAYPTVMFSTGPMFVSAMLSLHRGVRLLPQTLYGKNIDPSLVPDSFFWHYYGSCECTTAALSLCTFALLN
jgi:mannosyltransferase OCH1-like enzyme